MAGRCRAIWSRASRSENACAVVAATGGSTNAGLHLPAHRARSRHPLHARRRRRGVRAHAAHRRPAAGRAVSCAATCIASAASPAVLKALLDGGFICMATRSTVPGSTLADELAPAAPDAMARSSAPADRPDRADRRRRRAQGQPRARRRADQGRRPEIAACFEGPARVFECEEDAFAAVPSARATRPATCSSSATKGPRGGPGMREMLGVTALVYGQGMGEQVALLTDGRFSGRDARPVHRLRRPGGGARRADRLVRDGDRIRIDAAARRMRSAGRAG